MNFLLSRAFHLYWRVLSIIISGHLRLNLLDPRLALCFFRILRVHLDEHFLPVIKTAEILEALRMAFT